MSEILSKMKSEMFAATKDGNSRVRDIIQLTLASIKNAEIAAGEPLSQEKILEMIRKEVKQLADAIAQFKEAGREDLVDENTEQMEYLNQYLPSLMGEDDVRKVAQKKVKELGAQGMGDMGKVMGAVMAELKGKADGGVVKNVVQELLA